MRANGVEAAIARYREAGTKEDARNWNCAKMESAYFGVLLYVHKYMYIYIYIFILKLFFEVSISFYMCTYHYLADRKKLQNITVKKVFSYSYCGMFFSVTRLVCKFGEKCLCRVHEHIFPCIFHDIVFFFLQ